MKRISILLFAFITSITLFAQSVQSPENFFGYKIGNKFTPHYKLLNYFNAVAQAVPQMVKIEKYGETYEGRDLVVAYVALPENLHRLEEIRNNNLKLAGVLKDGTPVTQDAPAIVWLSYNVHGNEPSSSEAAMLTLFALVDPQNKQTKEWLKNTVVIIDPCLNPDGRDRYINWFNTSEGMHFNADPQAREHNEPWPYGRTNHYNFDLNRDWAWQTQKESKARLKKYNEWLPQVHVDFHEQGYNDPYYFAPAAEPYHEVITQWQRDFQIKIGRNNAKYFDANGWLYFTKEIFDLFYPSYGDTYPTYNGAIGMTYEQGGIEGGLEIRNNVGDTLTLADRAMHHFTTSISTIEVSSVNAVRLINEFKKFFDNNRDGVVLNYKSYILTAKDANKMQALADLLSANGIEYGRAEPGTFKGYNYFTGKEENFIDEGFSVVVSSYQPKSSLIKVLFEPKSSLSDSATYDITAWSLPYVYGIKAYGIKDRINILPYKNYTTYKEVHSNYGLLIPYTSLNSVKVLSYLLNHNVKVRFAASPFIYNTKNYDRGTLIILKSNNIPDWQQVTNTACKTFNIQPNDVESGFMEKGADFGSEKIRFIRKPKVALLTGSEISYTASGEVWNLFDEVLNYPITQLNFEDINNLSLVNYDVIIMPDGMYSSLNKKPIADKLENYVNGGGKIIAMQNGAATLAGIELTGLKLKSNEEDSTKDKKSDYTLLKRFADRERNELVNSIPGAIYKLELDSTHPLAYGYPSFYYTLKQDNNLYGFLKDGWNVGVIKTTNYTSGFVGSKIKSVLKDGLLIGVQNHGNGNIIFFADDPLFRLFWENGKLMFCNAVFLAGQ